MDEICEDFEAFRRQPLLRRKRFVGQGFSHAEEDTNSRVPSILSEQHTSGETSLCEQEQSLRGPGRALGD